jgi:hypothetical protein
LAPEKPLVKFDGAGQFQIHAVIAPAETRDNLINCLETALTTAPAEPANLISATGQEIMSRGF